MATQTTAVHRALVTRMLLGALLWLAVLTPSNATECNRAMAIPVAHVTVPGSPFTALPSADGCWLFVSLAQNTGTGHPGIAVLARADGSVTLKRMVSLRGSPAGMVLTHAGTLLIVATNTNLAFLDVRRLTTGLGDPVLGYWNEGHHQPLSVYVSVTADDNYLFVSNEAVGTISVIDLAQTRLSRFARVHLVRSIVVGDEPVGLGFSSDERFLFATVQSVNASGWSKDCKPEGAPAAIANRPEGAIVVIDMKLAISGGADSVLRRVPAGCNPVRVVDSPQNGRVYVTARGSNELLAFNESDLTGSGADPQATQVAVGASPVGVAVIENDRKVVVASSDRFNTVGAAPSLYVLDSTRIAVGSVPVVPRRAPGASRDSLRGAPVVGMIPSRGFPREIRATADGHTLLVTNFSAGTLQIIDLRRSPWDFALNNVQQFAWAPHLTTAGAPTATRCTNIVH